MNNIRHDHTSGYINDERINQEIGELADMTAFDHNQEVIELQKKQYQELSDKFDAGEMTQEQAAELKLMHRINQTFTHTHHEDRWQQQNAIAQEIQKVDQRMEELARKYTEKKVSDADYYDRWGKLKVKRDALEREL